MPVNFNTKHNNIQTIIYIFAMKQKQTQRIGGTVGAKPPKK